VFQVKSYVAWNRCGNSSWQRAYLVDNQGYIRYSQIDEGYDQTEQIIQSLLTSEVVIQGEEKQNEA
jgi:hypothetical protein